MTKRISSLQQKAEELYSSTSFGAQDEVVIKELTGKDFWKNFLTKEVPVPRILQPYNVGKSKITNMEVISGRTELFLNDPSIDPATFQKIVTGIFDKAFLNEDKKPDEKQPLANLSDYPQEILLDSITQVIKYLNIETLEIALNAIESELIQKRSGKARIINQ